MCGVFYGDRVDPRPPQQKRSVKPGSMPQIVDPSKRRRQCAGVVETVSLFGFVKIKSMPAPSVPMRFLEEFITSISWTTFFFSKELIRTKTFVYRCSGLQKFASQFGSCQNITKFCDSSDHHLHENFAASPSLRLQAAFPKLYRRSGYTEGESYTQVAT